ncbi:MAG TPA: hypothetical protein VIC54_05615 [Terriglobales bacterium]
MPAKTTIRSLHLAAVLVLGTATAAAQQPPVAPTFTQLMPPAQLAFINSFANQPAKLLLKDKRFKEVMKEITPRSGYHYGGDMSLSEAVGGVMDTTTEPVTILNGRYALVPGGVGPILSGRGLVWIDLDQGVVLGAFFFHPTNGEPTPSLTVYSRQLTQTQLSMSQLPAAFAEDLDRWAVSASVPLICAQYFIPANGNKYVLLHDENYCTVLSAQSVPQQRLCYQLTEEAAEVDMYAAFFMIKSHNKANATGFPLGLQWRMSADQPAWLKARENSCGGNPACRIQMTRERTQALLQSR